MAIYRNPTTNEIDKQEFENHLKTPARKEGYMEIIMYTPDPNIQVANITTTDKLDLCDITALTNIDRYNSSTIATLEENLWLLNGRYAIYQSGKVNGYISNSISNENGEFETKPTMSIQLSHSYKIENFSVILNAAVPTGYPKDITVYCYDENDTLLSENTVNIEWQEDTGEVDEDEQPIYRTMILETLPSVNFEINQENVDHLVIEYGNTRFRNRRIRVSSIVFGKTIVLDQNQIMKVDYTDKASYVCDTLPSRIFKFDVNNYKGIYNVDNPDNGYVKLNKQTRIRFRNGYNVWGYIYDENGKVVMENGLPAINEEQIGVEIEWDNWKELRLMNVSANADESATFTAGSLLDIMEDTYTSEYYTGSTRTIKEIAENILTFEGLDMNSIEWSSDSIKKPTYDSNNILLPYDQWEDTEFAAYTINTIIPETSCKQTIQYLAFAIGATILIKDNGHIKFACLNIEDKNTFTNHYEWNYSDFISIPAAEQLPTISSLNEISLPKYYSTIDVSGKDTIVWNGTTHNNCSVIATITCNSMNVEATYGDSIPVGARMANDDTSGATLVNALLYSHRGILNLGGYVAGTDAKVEILGYPVQIKSVQERNTTSDSLVLDTKVMNYDPTSYKNDGSGTPYESEQIKRKYLQWYKKKFKYTIETRGEPLVNAGDYAIIKTQFTEKMPVYILQNHWTFDGAWEGDMEVITLD